MSVKVINFPSSCMISAGNNIPLAAQFAKYMVSLLIFSLYHKGTDSLSASLIGATVLRKIFQEEKTSFQKGFCKDSDASFDQ